MTISTDCSVMSWNPAAERIFGYSEDEIIGRSALLLVPDPTNEQLRSVWQLLLAGQVVVNQVNENLTKDGRTLLCRWSNTPLVDAAGTVIGMLVTAEDVTAELQAQNAVLKSEARYRDLVNALPHYIYSVDNDDRYMAVNRTACDYFGRPAEEIIGRTALELGIAPEVARVWTGMNATTRASGQTETLDSMTLHGDEVRHIRNILSPILDEGTIVGITGISIDVTDHKVAVAGMGRLLRAVEQIDDMVFMTECDGTITYVNAAFEKAYGYSRGEVIGKTPRILRSGELPREYYQNLWSELLSGRSVRVEYRNRRKDGTLIDVIGTASPVFDGDRMTGFIAVQQDVSARNRDAEERRRLDERIARAARLEALGTLAGGIAHDFNNILSIILAHTELVTRAAVQNERVMRAVETVRQAVKRGAGLSRQVLAFARRTDVDLEKVSVARVIEELGWMLAETFPRTINVSLDVDPKLPLVLADAGQLHQVLLNLCVNARDAMPDGGKLIIAAHCVGRQRMKVLLNEPQASDSLCIVISDNGMGMDEDTRRHIFEPFFTTKDKGKGTGLGLALAYGVINAHHGFIDVESQPGIGTTVRIYLPVADCAPASMEDETPSVVAHGTEMLLLIEDEEPLRNVFSTELRRRGYRVLTAGDGARALEVFLANHASIDAVVTDLGMPEMSATELVAALREATPAMPIIGMTGYVDGDVHASVLEAGVRHLIQKPFPIEHLLRTVREVLDERRLTA